MHPPLYAVFRDEAAAAQAVQRLEAGGITRDAVHVFGPTQPSHVGSFADNGAHRHTSERDHIGSFADSGAHQHTSERDHIGSYATTERSLRALEDVLIRLGLPADATATALAQFQAGAVLVVVQPIATLVDAAAAALNG